MNKYKLTVGLEIHVEVDTDTKMFCRCRNNTSDLPNTNVCPVCLGLPGALPAPNQLAVEKIIKLGMALGGKIKADTKWDRKNYYYPDLPKGYQISQYDEPIVAGGEIDLGDKKIDITRIHLEEDTGKLSHPAGSPLSLIDLNRAGAPLIEMVSEPQLHDVQDVKEFCQEFQKILRHLDISSAQMERGKMRCEANVSVAKNECEKLGTKVEVKNLNSFRAVERSVIFEQRRQIELLESGQEVIQETRGWSENRQQTYSQRVKESSEDYRYFPEPDIPRIDITGLIAIATNTKSDNLPSQWRTNLRENFGLIDQDAEAISKNKSLYNYFLETMQEVGGDISGKTVASWMIHSKFGSKIAKTDFVTLLKMVNDKTINDTFARDIARRVIDGESLNSLLDGHKQLDEQECIIIIKQIVKQNPSAVADYRAGKERAIQFLFGQLMKQTKGKINSDFAHQQLKKELS